MKGPVVVAREGEEIPLSKEEVSILSLGPKFCVLNNLNEEEFANNIEQAILKYKWDSMGDEKKEKDKEGADIAIDAILDEEEIIEAEEAIKEQEAQRRNIFDRDNKIWDY